MRTSERNNGRLAASNVARAKIAKVDDSKGVQRLDLKVLAGEEHTGVERFQQSGVTTHPEVGSEVVVAYMGGNRSHPVVIAVENKSRRLTNLKPGGVALHDLTGAGVKITLEGDALNVDSNGQPLKVRFDDGTTVELTGDKILLTKGGMKVAISPDRIDLGDDPAPFRVMTQAGPSNKVWAIID